jgi:hypothetical protein
MAPEIAIACSQIEPLDVGVKVARDRRCSSVDLNNPCSPGQCGGGSAERLSACLTALATVFSKLFCPYLAATPTKTPNIGPLLGFLALVILHGLRSTLLQFFGVGFAAALE